MPSGKAEHPVAKQAHHLSGDMSPYRGSADRDIGHGPVAQTLFIPVMKEQLGLLDGMHFQLIARWQTRLPGERGLTHLHGAEEPA